MGSAAPDPGRSCRMRRSTLLAALALGGLVTAGLATCGGSPAPPPGAGTNTSERPPQTSTQPAPGGQRGSDGIINSGDAPTGG
jgi:hypothetical protein